MSSSILGVLLDPTTLGIVAIATGTVGYGAKASRAVDAISQTTDGAIGVDAVTHLEGKHAVLLPIVLSATLLTLFAFFDYIGLVFTLLGLAYAVGALGFLVHGALAGRLASRTGARALAGAVASCFGLWWLLTGHWLAGDVLACALCVLAMTLLRLPSLKVAAAVLVALIVFDVVWVFAPIGGRSVMVSVATKQSGNPATAAVTAALGTRPRWMTPSIAMLNKISVPSTTRAGGFAFLGLGDIVLPGVLVSFAARADSGRRPSYFATALGGYVVGLFCAVLASVVWHTAQPALLFLVPSTLCALMAAAAAHGELATLWHHAPSQAPLRPLELNSDHWDP